MLNKELKNFGISKRLDMRTYKRSPKIKHLQGARLIHMSNKSTRKEKLRESNTIHYPLISKIISKIKIQKKIKYPLIGLIMSLFPYMIISIFDIKLFLILKEELFIIQIIILSAVIGFIIGYLFYKIQSRWFYSFIEFLSVLYVLYIFLVIVVVLIR